MFNEDGNHFIGVIISPYFTHASDGNLRNSCLPKIRCFVTVQHGQKENIKIIPYECVINVMPQRVILTDYLKKQCLELKENPFTTDKYRLNQDTCIIKGKRSSQIVMKKGEKLMRSLRHLLDINYYKLRNRIGFGQIGRHLECMVMTRQRIDFSSNEDQKSQPNCDKKSQGNQYQED